jgi:hypothetical protein
VRSCPIPAIPTPNQGRLSVGHFQQLSFQIKGENVAAAFASHSIHQGHSLKLAQTADWTGVNLLIVQAIAFVF